MDLDDTNVQFLVHFKKYGRTILQIREYSQLILSTYEWLITKEHTHKTFIGEKEEELAGCIILEALKEVQMELEQYGQKIEILNKKLQNMFKNSSPYDYLQNFIPDVGSYSKLRNLVIHADSLLNASADSSTDAQSLGHSSSKEIFIRRQENSTGLHSSHRKRYCENRDGVSGVCETERFQAKELSTDNVNTAEFICQSIDEDPEVFQAQKALKRSECETKEVVQFDVNNQCIFDKSQSVIEILSDDDT